MGQIIFGAILIFVGISAFFNIHIWNLIVPIFLIWLGWMILTGRKSRRGYTNQIETIDESLDESFVFSNSHQVIKGTDFQGGNINTVFSSTTLDLTTVITKKDKVYVEINSVFGSTRVKVPKNWDVKSEQVAALGNFDDRTHPTKKTSVKCIVTGSTVFASTVFVN